MKQIASTAWLVACIAAAAHAQPAGPNARHAPVARAARRIRKPPLQQRRPQLAERQRRLPSIKPGETHTLAELEGPGRIAHIWFTISAADRYYPRTMSLRIYWDGRSEPSVESPIGDFFAVGHGLDVPVDSLPVAVSSDGRARNCYWPMPFRKSARITVTNDSPDKTVHCI